MNKTLIQINPHKFSNSEKKLSKIFKNYDSNNWRIIHGLGYTKSNNQSRSLNLEMDFLLFCRNKGILILEVKGGGVSYNKEEKWKTIDKNDQIYDVRDPFEQAKNNKYDLIEYLKKKKYQNISKIEKYINHAVAFPDISGIPDNLPMTINKEIILTGKDLKNFEKEIVNIMQFWKYEENNILTLREIETIINDFLLPDVKLYYDKKNLFKEIENQIEQATEEQISVVEGLEKNNRCLISGCAGSGKTIIARHFAKKLSDKDDKVLFLCFNQLLSLKMKKLHNNKNLTIDTYHNFFKPNSKEKEKILENYIEYFDHIIIDEAQDFEANWFDNIKFVYKSNTASKFWCFYDSNQNIYKQDGLIKKLERDDLFINYSLKKNCRNTIEIIKYATKKSSIDSAIFNKNITGQKVIIKKFISENEQRDFIKKEIKALKRDGVNDVVLLSNQRWERTSLFSIGGLGKDIRINNDYLIKDDKDIFITTIHSFKGLEADVVFLFDIDYSHYDEIMQYVGGTRAKLKLYCTSINNSQKKLPLSSNSKMDFSI